MFNMYGASDAGGPYLTEIVIKNTRVLQGGAMNNFFSNNKALTQIDVGGLILEGGHNWSNMFDGCSNLTTIKGIDKIDWTKITNINNMFRYTAITAIPSGMENADLSNATNIECVFNYCGELETADLSGWKISNKAKSVYAMFHMCKKLKSAKIGSIINSNTVNVSQMFQNNILLETVNLTGCDASNVTNANSMFNGCTVLREINGLEELKLTLVTDCSNMFQGCTKLKKLDLSTWDLSYVTTILSMCQNCSELEEVVFPETHLVTCAEGSSKRLDILYAFQNAKSLKKLDLSMMYGQAGDVWRFLDGANSIKEFYVQNLTATPNHLGYSFPGTSLTEFRYFKSVTWSNPANTNVFQNFSLAGCTLSKESLLSFLNALPDITSLTTKVYALSIGSVNMAKLTEDEIVSFTNKGYSLTV